MRQQACLDTGRTWTRPPWKQVLKEESAGAVAHHYRRLVLRASISTACSRVATSTTPGAHTKYRIKPSVTHDAVWSSTRHLQHKHRYPPTFDSCWSRPVRDLTFPRKRLNSRVAADSTKTTPTSCPSTFLACPSFRLTSACASVSAAPPTYSMTWTGFNGSGSQSCSSPRIKQEQTRVTSWLCTTRRQ